VTTAYDGFGRVTSSTIAMAGTSRTIGHVYDGDGNRVRINHPDAYFTYEYDGLGRFSRARENGGDPVAGVDYDAAGRPASSGWSAPTAYGYDSVGRVASLSHNLAGTSADQVIGLTYNPAGQILSRSGSNDSYAWTESVAVSRDYAVNGQNQYTGTVSNGSPSATFAYDANGNLISDGTTSFVYDVENRLVSASDVLRRASSRSRRRAPEIKLLGPARSPHGETARRDHEPVQAGTPGGYLQISCCWSSRAGAGDRDLLAFPHCLAVHEERAAGLGHRALGEDEQLNDLAPPESKASLHSGHNARRAGRVESRLRPRRVGRTLRERRHLHSSCRCDDRLLLFIGRLRLVRHRGARQGEDRRSGDHRPSAPIPNRQGRSPCHKPDRDV
jgi:YD repeat-containing protein